MCERRFRTSLRELKRECKIEFSSVKSLDKSLDKSSYKSSLEFMIENSRERTYERNIRGARPCRGLLAQYELSRHDYLEAIEKTTRVNMKVLQSRNKRRTLEKRMHST